LKKPFQNHKFAQVIRFAEMNAYRTTIFIDGTWLWHNIMALKLDSSNKFDLGRLPVALSKYIATKLNAIITREGTILSTSIPSNVHEQDKMFVSRRENFLNTLEGKYGYIIQRYPIDFKGRRLYKQDRHPNDRWEPKEKCVDISVASSLLYHAAVGTYDLAVLITGDKDFIPALDKVKLLGKQVMIASFRQSCSQDLIDNYDIVWLDDLLSELIGSF
jgi:uncharacterized LabA/DUF88 family protein